VNVGIAMIGVEVGADELLGKTGVTADRDKIEFRLLFQIVMSLAFNHDALRTAYLNYFLCAL